MIRLWWNIRVNVRAAWLFKTANSNLWNMGKQLDDYYNDGFGPREALREELSYWSV